MESIKFSFYADNRVGYLLYTENSKETIQKLLELINKFSKVAEYKATIQKLITFLYTNNKILERKSKKIPFKIISERIKYLEMNLT